MSDSSLKIISSRVDDTIKMTYGILKILKDLKKQIEEQEKE